MKSYAAELWNRAGRALDTARCTLDADPDAATSRAYYSAFYAVSALFALEGRTFRKHSAVEAAVHRDLVKEGTWPPDLGADYRELRRLRATGDYGGFEHVSAEDASQAVEKAKRILETVQRTRPELESLEFEQ